MKRGFLALACALALSGCGESGADPEEAVAVYPGKADNYLSPTSREYLLWGMGEIALEGDDAALPAEQKEARVQELLAYKFKAYAHYINEYVTDKSSHDENAGYGGFAGLVKSSSLEWVFEPVNGDGSLWTFIWEMEMGGPRDLLERLPTKLDSHGTRYFLVQLPKLSSQELASSSFPKSFDPSKFSGELEEIQVLVEPEDESFDAFPDYQALFADGLLDVFIVVGGDYNEKRWDLIAAEQIFDWLKQAGYQHSAGKLEELTLSSEPFRKQLTANGKEVAVEVTLVWPDIVPDGQLDQLEKKIVDGYESMDLVIYDGHAGQDPDYSGIVYHYNPRKAISATALGKLNLPTKYQLYLFNGCKTYNAYPDAVYKNSSKSFANLDVVSTVNFSWLNMQPYTTSGFLNELLTRRNQTHAPRTFIEILTRINQSNNYNVYYGVHGLDDNGHINPYADLSTLCSACEDDSGCPGEGNRCIRFEWGKACGAQCTANDGCPQGYTCADIAVSGQISGRQCLPSTYQCN